ncbi:MAG: hypothetical protein ACRDDY_18980 [Clostridium sp.]
MRSLIEGYVIGRECWQAIRTYDGPMEKGKTLKKSYGIILRRKVIW